MQKKLSAVLAVILAFCLFAAAMPVSASEQKLTVTNSLHLFSSNDVDTVYATYDPLEVSVGDILEVKVSAKFKKPIENRYITGMMVRSFFSDSGQYNIYEYNAGYLIYTNEYPQYNGAMGTYSQLGGGVVVNPDVSATGIEEYNCFIYTYSSFNGCNLDEWTQLYSFTLRAEQTGETHIDTAVLDMIQGTGYGDLQQRQSCMNDMDYKMEISVVGHSGIIKGDCNGDGEVTVDDATLIQRFLAEYLDETGAPLLDVEDEEVLAVADVNNDGKVSVSDVTEIQRYLAEIITEFA